MDCLIWRYPLTYIEFLHSFSLSFFIHLLLDNFKWTVFNFIYFFSWLILLLVSFILFSYFYILYLWFISLCNFVHILLNCIPLFYCSSSSFHETTLDVFIRHLHIFISFRSVTGKVLSSSGDVMLSWFFMFFEVLHCCFHIWRNCLP